MSETNLNRMEAALAKKKRCHPTHHRTHPLLSTARVSEYDGRPDYSRSLVRLVRSSIGSPTNLGLDYMWYDKRRKVIELWGPYYTHVSEQSAHLIRCELDYFIKPKLERSLQKNQDESIQTTTVTC